ncbi:MULTISPECIES: hypothetical protein [Chromobacterium]|uniref:hypothetical protein n=1 Tax=Chromobacterium TaxID=535 RepID=UPI001D06EF0B|nr:MULTISPECIES: hypothetical protein [Chromobacterium]MCP1293303.1 hypothetical protein [Chromobacterium sp. S0633]
MTQRTVVDPVVLQAIHFDTLWQQAQDTLKQQSGQVWTDTDEHDPGVTLLQALSYGMSDLAYRHILPLRDILTPAPDLQNGDGLFPHSFSPNEVLTVSPITEEDYRRALLDLVGKVNGVTRFLFRNALLLPETIDQRYTYYYDPKLREYHFTSDEDEGKQKFTVQGFYRLQVELNRDVPQAIAEPILQEFLQNHHNVCEGVRGIVWLAAQPVNVEITLELEDDFQNYAILMAQLYLCVESYISPQAQRATAAELRAAGWTNDEIYQGPNLAHGWISTLPPVEDHNTAHTLNLNPLASPLQMLTGVKSLQALRFDNGTWEVSIPAQKYPQLWGRTPLQVLAAGQRVKLMKRGQKVTISEEEIKQALPSTPVLNEAWVSLEYGRHRTPERYYPASAKIPPCYQLQDDLALHTTRHLHQYLLPFEQWLASGCDQLRLLPRLLSFNQQLDTTVWGNQWPFVNDTVAYAVHQAYQPALLAKTTMQSQNEEQKLALLNYLLGYFGQQRADRTLLNAPDYLSSQCSLIRLNSQLNYQAGQFSANAMSSIQRRIAARLGFDEGVFNEPPDWTHLPFYLMEHAALLTPPPGTANLSWQKITHLQTEDESLALTSVTPVNSVFQGQLLELQYTSDSNATPIILNACVVLKVDSDTKTIALEINPALRSFLQELLAAPSAVQWRTSRLWMQDTTFPLIYPPANVQSPQLSPQPGQKIITADNFPSSLAVGDKLVLYRHFSPEGNLQHAPLAEGDCVAIVRGIDTLRRQLLIEADANYTLPEDQHQNRYRWYFDRDRESALPDRFSFIVSAIFNEDLLLGPQSHVTEPQVTAAWVEQIVHEELPCHVCAEMHWLESRYFNNFAHTYAKWIANDRLLGVSSFHLLDYLALGTLPSGLEGIGNMRIATDAQFKEVFAGAAPGEWNAEVIHDNALFYVPAEPSSTSIILDSVGEAAAPGPIQH